MKKIITILMVISFTFGATDKEMVKIFQDNIIKKAEKKEKVKKVFLTISGVFLSGFMASMTTVNIIQYRRRFK